MTFFFGRHLKIWSAVLINLSNFLKLVLCFIRENFPYCTHHWFWVWLPSKNICYFCHPLTFSFQVYGVYASQISFNTLFKRWTLPFICHSKCMANWIKWPHIKAKNQCWYFRIRLYTRDFVCLACHLSCTFALMLCLTFADSKTMASRQEICLAHINL